MQNIQIELKKYTEKNTNP